MNEQERHDLFSQLIARHQSELYAYIFAIVRSWEDADDLFQSVCVVLWRKFQLFRHGSDFFAWARQTAKFEVRKFLTRKPSPSYICEELLDELTETVAAHKSDEEGTYLTALERCRAKLNPSDERLLELYYADNLGSGRIAKLLERSQSSVCNSLNRIRTALLRCVQMELAHLENPGRDAYG